MVNLECRQTRAENTRAEQHNLVKVDVRIIHLYRDTIFLFIACANERGINGILLLNNSPVHFITIIEQHYVHELQSVGTQHIHS